MTMLGVFLELQLKRRKLSVRDAAKEIGVSHTTLIAAQNGSRRLDFDTVVKIANWAGFPLSILLDEANSEQTKRNNFLLAFRMVIEDDPSIGQAFIDEAEDLAAGKPLLVDFSAVISYANFVIERARKRAEAHQQGNASPGGKRKPRKKSDG